MVPAYPVTVSVVIPTNALHEWLPVAVESVLQQRETSLELVLLLDGVDLPQGHPWLSDPRIKVIRTRESRGVGVALRTAMSAAEGEYIARLDSDDVALPGRFARQVEYLNANAETVAVTGGAEWIDEAGNVTGRFGHRPGADVRPQLLEQNVLVQSAIMFRGADYRAVGGYSDMRQMEDYDLWLRLAQRGRLAILESDVVQYRVHPGQTSHAVNPSGDYVRVVLRGRERLRALLGKPRWSQKLRDLGYLAALYAMYWLPPKFIRVVRAALSR